MRTFLEDSIALERHFCSADSTVIVSLQIKLEFVHLFIADDQVCFDLCLGLIPPPTHCSELSESGVCNHLLRKRDGVSHLYDHQLNVRIGLAATVHVERKQSILCSVPAGNLIRINNAVQSSESVTKFCGPVSIYCIMSLLQTLEIMSIRVKHSPACQVVS